MSIREEAAALHAKGYNCAQCVLLICGKDRGLTEAEMISIAAGFGGGVRCGEICGAISGGVMALGLAKMYKGDDLAAMKAESAELTKKCVAAFKEKFNAVRCDELKNQLQIPCNDLIAAAAEIADEMIKNK